MKKILALAGILGLLSFNTVAVFSAQPAPTITSVTPSSGPTAGGTTITVVGTHLDGATVTIGGVSATGVVVASNNQSLTAVTPENGPAAEDVVVITANGSATLEAGFTYTNGTTTPPETATTTHTLTYNVFVNGTLTGSSTQIVADGNSGTAVTVVPNEWFEFLNWSDGSTDNPRTDTNVTSDITVSANFVSSSIAQPCNGSTFDTFATGSVNGQGGWHVLGDFDQEIVPNTYGFATFGCQSLRFSDATTSPFIYNQTFSYTGENEAGETDAVGGDTPVGTRQNHFEAQFDLASVTHDEQPGMHMSVAVDRGDGTRMAVVSFLDTAEGINMYYDDVTGTSSPVYFDNVLIANELNRSLPHTVKIVMDFVDGDSNDVVKVYVDGFLVHTGPSWENFYRYDNDAYPEPNGLSRTVTSLSFSENGTANPSNKWNGFLIDNVTLSTSEIPDPEVDTTAPVITLNGSSTMEVLLNASFTDPGATAHDDFDGFVSVTATGTVDTAILGGYTITYSAHDTVNNTSSTTRTVNVVATSTSTSTPPTSTSTLPIITLNGSTTIEVLLNTEFVDPGATATDQEDGTLTVSATGTVNTNALGNYTVTYSATDSDEQTATTTRTVRVTAGTASGGGGGGGGGYFIFTPIATVTSTNPSNAGLPITVASVSTPTGQVLGVAVYNFKRNMRMGSTGDDVQELQKFLASQGYLVIKNPTKYFGSMTWNALKKWQKAKGLPSTGYFGPMSRAEILK
ncbi:MAG: immunoglobulin-like domain-containing protein [Candidatus Paceibacterota bacterium]